MLKIFLKNFENCLTFVCILCYYQNVNQQKEVNMAIKRLISLKHSEASKIRSRQLNGTMKEYFDDEKYLCFDEEEYNMWKPKKNGRKPKTKKEN